MKQNLFIFLIANLFVWAMLLLLVLLIIILPWWVWTFTGGICGIGLLTHFVLDRRGWFV